MTPDESVRLLDTMMVYWPHTDLTEDQTVLWLDNLKQIRNADTAFEAVAAHMERSPYWPHWSEFMSAYQNVRAADRRDAQVVYALEEPARPAAPSTVARLSQIVKTGPPAGRVKAETLVGVLVDAWAPVGVGVDPGMWVNKFGRMEAECLEAAVGDAVELRPMKWAGFVNLYHKNSDAKATSQLQEARR